MLDAQTFTDKNVIEISKEKIVIGSHPGLVPFYRGAHSAFWCIYDEEPEKTAGQVEQYSFQYHAKARNANGYDVFHPKDEAATVQRCIPCD